MSEGEPLQSKSGRRHAALDVAPVELYSLCPPVYHLMYVEGGRGGQPDTYVHYTGVCMLLCSIQSSKHKCIHFPGGRYSTYFSCNSTLYNKTPQGANKTNYDVCTARNTWTIHTHIPSTIVNTYAVLQYYTAKYVLY